MKRWPWITILLAAVVLLNPLGLDIFYAAFQSNEVLSRNIWRPSLLGVTILAALTAVEWWMRARRYHARPNTTRES
jgi:hypothetical protein